MNRDEFLTRVRQSAAAGRTYRVSSEDGDADRVGYVGGGDDLVTRMAAEVAEVGGVPHVVDSVQQGVDAICGLAEKKGVGKVIAWQHPVLAEANVRNQLEQHGIDWDDFDSLSALSDEDRRRRILAADMGLTSATWAIAETGTLVMTSRPGRERVSSLLPNLHVALIERSQIVPDLFDVFDHLGASSGDDLPSNVTLITGPSKTGDLELKLITGVHGPGEWHVVIVG